MLMMSINAMMSVLFFLFLTKKSLRKHCRQSEPDGADVLVVVGRISRDSANTVGDIYCGVTFPKAICSRAFFKGKRSLLGIIPPSIGGSCNMSCTSSKLQVTKILLFDPVFSSIHTCMRRPQQSLGHHCDPSAWEIKI